MRLGPGGTGPSLGITITVQPAAVAEVVPVGESSMARHARGSTLRRWAAFR
jgi:hypothetical protein